MCRAFISQALYINHILSVSHFVLVNTLLDLFSLVVYS